ncbi:unnamed protein product [Phytomonas sp. EM1]|nr:unnamed protein product [Phytomonas sp. EM1]|eukprot:CCW63478.1 unnamed protein product [Phytomonas sp. isolate EM1]
MQEKAIFIELHRKLTKMGFASWGTITEADVFSGSPLVYSTFIRFIFTHFASATAELMKKYHWFVIEGNDVALGRAFIRLLKDEFSFVSPITPLQYAKRQFSHAKMLLCLALIRFLSMSCSKGTTRCHTVTAKRGVTANNRRLLIEYVERTEAELIKERRSALNRMPRF